MIEHRMKITIRTASYRFLAVTVLLVVGCSAKEAGQLKECVEREVSMQGQLGQCQTGTQQLTSQIESGGAKIKACLNDKDAVQQKLSAAEAELTELKQTSAAISQTIVATIDAATTVTGVDTVLESITAFNERFPTAPEKTVLSKRAAELKKLRLKLQKEEAKVRALESIADIRNTLSDVVDGSDLSFPPLVKLADFLSSRGLKYGAISELPRTNFAEAMKDSDAERGKSMVVSGRIVQITKDGAYYTGLLCTGAYCNNVYQFITPGTTRGINGESSATFAGVFAQRYSYSNAGGGTTHSLALVGYFKGQE